MLIGIFYSQIVESSSLVSVLFREAINHPYISFFHLLVNGFSVIIIIIIIMNLFRWVFSKYTGAIATSLIPLDIILPEIGALIIGFSCTVWTKTMSLACSLADGVLADAILISPLPPLPPTNIRKVRGPRKKYGN